MAEGFIKAPIEKYLITGIWHDHQFQPLYYSVHEFQNPGVSNSKKMSIAEVIAIIETDGLSVFTWEWDYKKGCFSKGNKVLVGSDRNGKYLYIEPFDRNTKNLKHLIRVNWFQV